MRYIPSQQSQDVHVDAYMQKAQRRRKVQREKDAKKILNTELTPTKEVERTRQQDCWE